MFNSQFNYCPTCQKCGNYLVDGTCYSCLQQQSMQCSFGSQIHEEPVTIQPCYVESEPQNITKASPPHPFVGTPTTTPVRPHPAMDNAAKQLRLKRRQENQVPLGWRFDSNAKLLTPECDLSLNFRGAIISVFNMFDQDRDAYLSFTEVNALNAAVGDAPIDQQTLEQICWAFVPEFNPQVDSGLTAEAYIKICKQSFLSDMPKTLQRMRQFGFIISDVALPTEQELLLLRQRMQPQQTA